MLQQLYMALTLHPVCVLSKLDLPALEMLTRANNLTGDVAIRPPHTEDAKNQCWIYVYLCAFPSGTRLECLWSAFWSALTLCHLEIVTQVRHHL